MLNKLIDLKTGSIDNGVFHREIKKLGKEKVIFKKSIGRETFYSLTEKYVIDKVFNQMIYFNKIQHQAEKENLIFSEEGIPGFPLHTIYGLVKREKMNDFEKRILNYIIRQLSNSFQDIQQLKIIYELRKKIENGWLSDYSFPHGIISEELSLKLLIDDFSQKLFELLSTEKGNMKSFRFLSLLMNSVCKLAKDLDFEITRNENNVKSPYPEKIFYQLFPINFVHDYLYMVHPDLPSYYKEVIDKDYKIDSKPFKIINNNSWFFDRENYTTYEKLENIFSSYSDIYYFDRNPIIDFYEKTTKKKFYPYNLSIFESLALVTTHSLQYSKYVEHNIDLKLNLLFEKNSFLTNIYVDKSDFALVVNNGEFIISEIIFCRGLYDKNPLSLQKFLEHKKLKEYYSKEVINFYLDVIDFCQNSIPNFDTKDIEYALYYKGFRENGIWYNEKEKYFYKISKEIFELIKNKIILDKDLIYHKRNRWDLIKKCILELPEIPQTYKNKEGLYGLNKFILFIDSILYFKVIKNLRETEDKDFFDNNIIKK